jgi:hypothetical protein
MLRLYARPFSSYRQKALIALFAADYARRAAATGSVEAECWSLGEADHFRHPLFEILIAADQRGSRKSILQLAHQHLRIIIKHDRAHAAFGRRDQNCAERAVADGETDRLAPAAYAKMMAGKARFRMVLTMD